MPAALADALSGVFTEVIVAPSFDDDAVVILAEKKNLRVLAGPPPYGAAYDIRSIDGGLLVQEVDTIELDAVDVARGRPRSSRRTVNGPTCASPGRCVPP